MTDPTPITEEQALAWLARAGFRERNGVWSNQHPAPGVRYTCRERPTHTADYDPTEWVIEVEGDQRVREAENFRRIDGPTEPVAICRYQDDAEHLVAVLNSHTLDPDGDTAWAAGFRSGQADGRKAASTQAMLGQYRVFDPRPLAAAVGNVDAAAVIHKPIHQARVVEVARDILAAAEIEPNPKGSTR